MFGSMICIGYRKTREMKMTNTEKLAKSYKEDGFTLEEMAEDLFKKGAVFETVVKVSLQMDYFADLT